MESVKRSRLYYGLLVLAAGIGGLLVGLRAERFITTRHEEILAAHVQRRIVLEQLANDPKEEGGVAALAEHDSVVVPRTMDRYRFGMRVSRSMQYGGAIVAVVGGLLIADYFVRRRRRMKPMREVGERGVRRV